MQCDGVPKGLLWNAQTSRGSVLCRQNPQINHRNGCGDWLKIQGLLVFAEEYA